MEELRAECASKITNDLETTPMAKVLGIDKASTVHEMKIGPWTKVENVHDEHHNEDLTSGDIHREGDLLLLIDHSSTNIINDGKFIMINKLPNVVMDDEDRIEESTLEICATKCIGYKDGLSVLFVMNLKSYQHLWDALFDPRNLAVIRYTFTDHKRAESLVNSCEHKKCQSNHLYYYPTLDTHPVLDKLNTSQSEAVKSILLELQCLTKPKVERIWGPPNEP